MKNRIIAVIACISMLTLPCTAEAKSDVNVRKVSTAHFSDTDGHWARHYADRLENMGIVKGDGELFNPDDILTRAEAVTMLMRTDGNTSVSGKTAFADINENDWFYESAVRAERAKIIGGEKFMPYENITRKDMAEWTVKFAIYTGCDVTDDGDFVETCKKYELINDSDEGFLTRAEAAAIITRLIDFKRQYSFYVDYDDGNDDGTGTLNNPFKTVSAATEAAQALAPEMDKDIYIYLKSGYYRLDEPITINASVSGQNGYSIIYSSYGEGNCVLSGGEKIIGWSLYDGEKNIYRAKVEKGLQSRQMFINGIRAVRARSDGGLANCTYDSGEMGHTTTDVFLADFKKPSDLEFVYNGMWVQNRIGVEKS